jgi:uncharacterized metal-binding protein YceD (DUF177 family)
MSAPEFSQVVGADTIGVDPRTIEIDADETERGALATRFDLIAIDRLTARFTIRRDAAGIVADGRIEAAVVQPCSVTGDPLPATVDEAVALRFVENSASGEDEVELVDRELDVMTYDGGAIDLGEVAAETMALALDPFPRGPGTDAILKAAGVIGEDEAKPQGAFAGLKDKLAGR